MVTTREQQTAIQYIKNRLLQTDLKLENPERMAVHLLNIYNWDIPTVEKYVV